MTSETAASAASARAQSELPVFGAAPLRRAKHRVHGLLRRNGWLVPAGVLGVLVLVLQPWVPGSVYGGGGWVGLWVGLGFAVVAGVARSVDAAAADRRARGERR
jgi:hypothetical protein